MPENPGLNQAILDALAGDDRLDQNDAKKAVDDFNERFFFVGALNRVAWQESDPNFADRQALSFLNPDGFRNWHDNREVQISTDSKGNPVFKPVGSYWLRHPRRRTYDRIVFNPVGEQDDPKVYNLWRGFAIEPKAGDCHRLLEHILDVICAKDEALFKWYTSHLAYWVQHPAEPGHVAIVQRGTEGTGKSTIADTFGSLWGAHYLTVTRSEQLIGRFNKHLLDCCVVHANEAFYAGAKSHASALKSLITDDTLQIEPKGVDLIQVRNRVKLIISSNEEWVVPAGIDSRRFAVFEVNSNRRNDFSYFAGLKQELANGGRAAFLHYLLALDTESHNPHQAPRSVGLDKQRALTLEGVDRVWYALLVEGILPGIRESNTVLVSSSAVLAWAKKIFRDEEFSSVDLGLLLSDNPKSPERPGFRYEKRRPPRRWEIPPLKQARDDWDKSGRPRGEWHDLKGWEEEEWELTSADEPPF